MRESPGQRDSAGDLGEASGAREPPLGAEGASYTCKAGSSNDLNELRRQLRHQPRRQQVPGPDPQDATADGDGVKPHARTRTRLVC